MVRSQIANLTPDPSFGHDLCFKCPNGSCEPILDIYVLKDFQWYNELFNLIGFDPYNHSLNIWASIRTLIPNEGSFLHIFLHSQKHEMWLSGFFLTHTLANRCFGRRPKARVATCGHHHSKFTKQQKERSLFANGTKFNDYSKKMNAPN